MKQENVQLRECLEILQRELFEIVDIKVGLFKRRFKFEFQEDMDDEDILRHTMEPIR